MSDDIMRALRHLVREAATTRRLEEIQALVAEAYVGAASPPSPAMKRPRDQMTSDVSGRKTVSVFFSSEKQIQYRDVVIKLFDHTLGYNVEFPDIPVESHPCRVFVTFCPNPRLCYEQDRLSQVKPHAFVILKRSLRAQLTDLSEASKMVGLDPDKIFHVHLDKERLDDPYEICKRDDDSRFNSVLFPPKPAPSQSSLAGT